MNKKLHIALTITGCKRPNLFKQTIESLCTKMKDLHLIDTVLHYDDSSDEESRKYMYNLLVSNFPNKLICTRYFEKDSFLDDKRHMHVMNHWIDDLNTLGVDYVFHTEDDWLYIDDFSISEALLLLAKDENCGQVGFSQPIRNFPEGTFIETKGDYWKWYYQPEIPLLENLFIDDVMIKLWDVPGLWMYYINWPHFSFRPGLFSVDRICSIGKFKQTNESFEFDFAKRYVEKYYNYVSKKHICWHIGEESSYELNNSSR